MQTPWGKADSIKNIAPGIKFVSTPSHGGFKLDRRNNARMPLCFRKAGGWYEEDCEWAMVAVVFEAHFKEHLEQAKCTIKNYWPDKWEAFSGEKLKLKDSCVLRELEFERVHADDYVAVSAVGDWHKDVPKGKVGVCATKGGKRDFGAMKSSVEFFLVDSKDYDLREQFGYVVKPTDQLWEGQF